MAFFIHKIAAKNSPATIAAVGLLYSFSLFAVPLFSEAPLEMLRGGTVKDADAAAKAEAVVAVSDWKAIDDRYLTIYCRPDANLNRMERQLRRRTFFFGRRPHESELPIEDRIAYRIEFLFNRVKDILDMRPRIEKINIRIFGDRGELNDVYFKIFGAKEDIKSFYVHKYRTIYISERDISDSIVAHEMAHAVVDHYFEVIPPQKVSEVLASY